MAETNPLDIIASSLSDLNANILHLTKDWDVLRQEVQREIRNRTRTLWMALVGASVVILIIGAAGYVIGQDNARQIEENNRRWCPLVSLLVPHQGDPPATTERGRVIADRATELYVEFHCAVGGIQ